MSGFIRKGAEIDGDIDLTCDVCIVGSGAGGAVLAGELTARGVDVVIVEEGGYYVREDFLQLEEAVAIPRLYQERGTRGTQDKAITVLQGRSVGGTTTINWTTCWRTPADVLQAWRNFHKVDGWDPDTLRPHFEAVEKRLNIHRWPMGGVNRNNQPLLDGCRALGWEAQILKRNVRHCVSSGYCGFGCPTNAKQAMAITYIKDGVERGLRVFADTRAERFVRDGRRVVAVECSVLEADRDRPTGRKVVVRPKVAVCSGGAINGPALLLRSGLDGDGRVGRRTFLHPVIGVSGLYEDPVDGWSGAPQSVSSHQFIHGPGIGFFLEAAPVFPVLSGAASRQFGAAWNQRMSEMRHMSSLIALHRDGLMHDEPGGTVRLLSDGRVALDYPVIGLLEQAFRRSHEALARVHLAAGAREVFTLHNDPVVMHTEDDVKKLAAAPYGAHEHGIFSAHVMGGCTMGEADHCVVDSDLRFRGVDNLFVVDGSVFPSSLGVNPSESIYGFAHRIAPTVAEAV